MKNRTNVARFNSEGFGYIVTATTDFKKRNPYVTPQFLQNHFDQLIAMAITDLLVPPHHLPICINGAIFDLKMNAIKNYRNVFDMVLEEGVTTRNPSE
ncbi:MAG: hypothetical protein EOM23_00325 [Candidatus Moranbacteria bacterium]|nr:hypothetical protein [Candidatus Moranbacteria bacterium]